MSVSSPKLIHRYSVLRGSFTTLTETIKAQVNISRYRHAHTIRLSILAKKKYIISLYLPTLSVANDKKLSYMR